MKRESSWFQYYKFYLRRTLSFKLAPQVECDEGDISQNSINVENSYNNKLMKTENNCIKKIKTFVLDENKMISEQM